MMFKPNPLQMMAEIAAAIGPALPPKSVAPNLSYGLLQFKPRRGQPSIDYRKQAAKCNSAPAHQGRKECARRRKQMSCHGIENE